MTNATGRLRSGTAVSYVRNSVKATVDAYDGTVTLYQVDRNDPVLQTWMRVFPGTVKSEDEIPDELRAHFRYPEDLFRVQRGPAGQVPCRRSPRVLHYQRLLVNALRPHR